MATYAALLRGIAPAFPNMKNADLRGVFEALGFSGVRSVLSSGNIIFEAQTPEVKAWESELEAAWPKRLGFKATTIIRSQKELTKMLASDPFAGIAHGGRSYLLVTFFKHRPRLGFTLPHRPEGKPFRFVHYANGALLSVTDTTAPGDPGGWLERQYGKEITSRTPQTVERILRKMEEKGGS
ncbi:MAG TPA: DUF1697 domain-containing protein [Anaerolineales bacterium]|nr:DUF1697 domain-containing protein [Anaerolineales bacterium]HRQ92962.1 DUF1697 domain-containing protein [Anaerolineales bacterium]